MMVVLEVEQVIVDGLVVVLVEERLVILRMMEV